MIHPPIILLDKNLYRTGHAKYFKLHPWDGKLSNPLTLIARSDSAQEQNVEFGNQDGRGNSHDVGPGKEEGVSLMHDAVADAQVVRGQRSLMRYHQQFSTPSGQKRGIDAL